MAARRDSAQPAVPVSPALPLSRPASSRKRPLALSLGLNVYRAVAARTGMRLAPFRLVIRYVPREALQATEAGRAVLAGRAPLPRPEELHRLAAGGRVLAWGDILGQEFAARNQVFAEHDFVSVAWTSLCTALAVMNGNALFKWAFTIIPSCMFWFALQGNDAAVGRALVAYAVEIVLAAVAWTAVAVWSFYDDEFL